MSIAILSLIMDVAVLAGLAATLYYAMRLTRSLEGFRKYRQEFGALIADLSIRSRSARSGR